MEKGVIKIRQINKTSIGMTLPKELVDSLKLDLGLYEYSADNKNNEIQLNLRLISKTSHTHVLTKNDKIPIDFDNKKK